MGKINFTERLPNVYQQELMDEWVNGSTSGFFKKQIASRVGFLGLGVASTVTSAVDTLAGVYLGIFSIATGGQLFLYTASYLDSSSKLIVRPFRNVLLAINPQAKIMSPNKMIRSQPPAQGLFTKYVQNFVEKKADDYRAAANGFVKRQVAIRLTYTLATVACAISRAADGIIGLMAGTISIVTVGHFAKINACAYKGLQFTGIIGDIVNLSILVINPYVGINPKTEKHKKIKAQVVEKTIRQKPIEFIEKNPKPRLEQDILKTGVQGSKAFSNVIETGTTVIAEKTPSSTARVETGEFISEKLSLKSDK